jgi:hypothetical protein
MRILLIVVVAALVVGCSSTPQEDTSVPVAEDHVSTTGDNISAELASSWGRQADFFRKGHFTILDWSDAQALLRKKSYRGGKQYHTGWLAIYTVDNQKYLTKQPKLDDFFEFMKKTGLSTQGFGTE